MTTRYLTDHALTAYNTRKLTGFTANPHDPGTRNYYAHELGIYFSNSGKTEPRNVGMGRGKTIRANDMLFRIHHNEDSIRFERIN